MSKVQNPITGRTSGKFATAVFSKNFDKNIMRSKPIEVKNPKTEGQMLQRNFFKELQSILLFFIVVIQNSYSKFAISKSAFAVCMSENLLNAWALIGSSKQIVWSKLQFSKGNLQNLTGVTASIADDTGEVQITWAVQAETDKIKNNDKVSFLFINIENGSKFIFPNNSTRAGQVSENIVLPTAGIDEYVLYYFVQSSIPGNEKEFSNTGFILVQA